MTRPPIIVRADRVVPRRELVLIVLLVTLVWLVQLRYPPVSYPQVGLMELAILAMLGIMVPVRLLRSMHGAPAPRLHPAFAPALFFVIWAVIRWLWDGLPFSGSSDIGTILWSSCYGILAYSITRSAASVNEDAPTISVPRTFLAACAAAGLGCGLHAAWQYFYAYSDTYQRLLSEIGNRSPDRTEMALLHHLRLRRVASIFGDPNTLATFSAVALAASIEIMTRSGSAGNKLLRYLGIAAIPVCLSAIAFSGSRGGILDALLIIFGFGGLVFYLKRKSRPANGSGTIMALVLAAAIAGSESETTALPAPVADKQPATELSGWGWRSNTITERFHYLKVGIQMFKMSPVTGLGPGSVERYFGRLKPPEARESKYLHNWVAQITAELGLVGLGLALWFITAIARATYYAQLWNRPVDRALAAIFVLLLFDGLIQVTWNQRELMSTFGLVTGLLMARSVPVDLPGKERFAKPWRLAVCIVFVSVFAIVESHFLAGRMAKYKALDAMAAGDILLARQYWEKATLWTPRDPEPYAARASMAADSGQLSSAKQLLEKTLSLNPDSAATNAEAAAIAERLKQPAEAYNYLQRALELYPSHPEYNYMMARHLYNHGNRETALTYARKAIQFNYIDQDLPRYQALVTELENI